MTALGISPRLGSLTRTTATSSTPGWARRASSISAQKTLSPPHLHHAGLAVDEMEEAFAVALDQVAADEPALPQVLGRLSGIVEVAQADAGATHGHLSHHPVRGLAAVFAQHLDLVEGRGPAHGARRGRAVQGRGQGHADGLGAAPDRHDGRPVPLAEAFGQLGRHVHAPALGQAQGGQITAAALRGPGQGVVEMEATAIMAVTLRAATRRARPPGWMPSARAAWPLRNSGRARSSWGWATTGNMHRCTSSSRRSRARTAPRVL